MSYPPCDPLKEYNQVIQILTLYEVMVEHSSLGIGAPVNVAFAIDRRNGDLGLNLEDTEDKRNGILRI